MTDQPWTWLDRRCLILYQWRWLDPSKGVAVGGWSLRGVGLASLAQLDWLRLRPYLPLLTPATPVGSSAGIVIPHAACYHEAEPE